MTPPQLLLRVATTTGDDPEFVNDLTWDLVETLRESPADAVDHAHSDAEGGAKGTAIEWAQLVVSFSGGLPEIVGLIRGWLRRKPDAKVRIELEGDVFEIEHASPELQDELAKAFLARHAPAAPE